MTTRSTAEERFLCCAPDTVPGVSLGAAELDRVVDTVVLVLGHPRMKRKRVAGQQPGGIQRSAVLPPRMLVELLGPCPSLL